MSGNDNQNSALKGSLSFATILSEIDVAATSNAVNSLQTSLNNGSLKGDKGDAGNAGPSGPQGSQGPQGLKGDLGLSLIHI